MIHSRIWYVNTKLYISRDKEYIQAWLESEVEDNG